MAGADVAGADVAGADVREEDALWWTDRSIFATTLINLQKKSLEAILRQFRWGRSLV